jgi:hypothetical protein
MIVCVAGAIVFVVGSMNSFSEIINHGTHKSGLKTIPFAESPWRLKKLKLKKFLSMSFANGYMQLKKDLP